MWDENKCGSLQLAELRVALAKCVSEATAFNNKPDPAQEHIRKLQRRAQMADDAAQATEVADKAELALAEYRERLKTRADVRLGALLQKRMIKPGEVVVHWAKSKGEHAGELSKVQFRRAVLKLPHVLECHLVSGDFDYLVKARINEMASYRKLLGDILLKLPHVRESKSYIVMEEVKESLALPVPE